MREILNSLLARKELTKEQIEEVFEKMLTWELDPELTSAFLIWLWVKWETVDEVFHSSNQMQKFAQVLTPISEDIIDTCWTWGDCSWTFNISTTCSFVVAAAWWVVAKHWNRSNTSQCWASDVLSQLWLNLEMPSSKVEKAIDEIGVWFLYAPLYHKAMKYVAPIRAKLWVRTIFNMLWPLSNPAWAKYQLIWVYDKILCNLFAQVLLKRWIKGAMIVHWSDWLDEITLTWTSHISEIESDQVKQYEFDPKVMWFDYCSIDDLKWWTPVQNAKITRSILEWGHQWPKSDIVIINSAAALKISWIAKSWEDAISLARDTIKSWRALEKLNQLVEFSNE